MHILTLVQGIRKKIKPFHPQNFYVYKTDANMHLEIRASKIFFMTSTTNYIELVGHFFHFINYSSTQEILQEQVTIQTYYLKPS
jgi:hypothetical protein